MRKSSALNMILCLICCFLLSCSFEDRSDKIMAAYNEAAQTVCDISDPCSKIPNSNGKCSSKDKINYSCGCKDNYSWNGEDCVADTKTSSCKDIPDNASWNTVSSITQTWGGTEWLPSEYAVYNEVGSSTYCYFKCNQNYTWNGTSCVADTRSVECTAIPENADWNTVSEITQTWSGTDWQPSEKSSYNTEPSSGECRFKCIDGYFWNADQNLCVDPCESAPCVGIEHSTEQCIGKASDKYVCECETGFAWNGSKCLNPCDPNPCLNVENSTGECTKIDNFTQYSCGCAINYTWNETLCAADIRSADCTCLPNNADWNIASSITQTSSGSEWLPTTLGVFSKTPSETECHFKCKTNYTWNESTLKCDADTRDVNCTSKSANSVWNDNGANGKFTQTWDVSEWKPGSFQSTCSESAGTCHFKCNESYHCENNQCVFNTRTNVACKGLPSNAQWNTTSSITQTWNGSSWQPTTTGSYNETSSTSECRFECNMNYNWNSLTSTCVAATQQANCSSKPANTIWNDNGANGKFTQTWDVSAWNPANYSSTYNTTAGTFRYKCADSYHWENSQCISNTKSNVSCTGLPSNAQWNTASSITQTWNGSSWQPTTTGSFNNTASTSECRYKCKTNYTWTNSVCKADSKVSNCTELPSNAQWNTASTISQTWNGSSWQPSTTGTYNTTASTQECHFKCVKDYFWNGSTCMNPCNPNPCEEIEHSTEVCNGESANEYSCECEDTFDWNGNRCRKIGVPCTAQTKCYNASAEIACPASGSFFGQDAQYAYEETCLARSFSIDNSYSGLKIVIDNNTDLEWAHFIPT